jgi:hypothetical protein
VQSDPWLSFTWIITAVGVVILSLLPMTLFALASGAIPSLF